MIHLCFCFQLKWKPFDFPEEVTDFVDSLSTVCGAGDPKTRHGVAIHTYTCNKSMKDRFMFIWLNEFNYLFICEYLYCKF